MRRGLEPRGTLRLEDIPNLKVVLFDCDGILWRANRLIPGGAEAMERLRRNNIKVGVVTNSALYGVDAIRTKFGNLRLKILPEEPIFSASYFLFEYLKEHGFVNSAKKIYLIGEEDLAKDLRERGVKVLGAAEDENKVLGYKIKCEIDPEVKLVVVAGEVGFNFYKMTYASLCLEKDDVDFVVTNPDMVSHMVTNQLWPCTGAELASVECSSGRKATLLGKPGPLAMNYVKQKFPDVKPHEIMMIGDNIETDIKFAVNNGMRSLLVMTGVTSSGDRAAIERCGATYCLEDLDGLHPGG